MQWRNLDLSSMTFCCINGSEFCSLLKLPLRNCFKYFTVHTYTHTSKKGFKKHELDKKFEANKWINFFFFFGFFRDAPVAYGSSQVRSQIRATAAGLHHSHNNAKSDPNLQPTPQLMAMLDPQPQHMAALDPQPTKWRQGFNPRPHGS